MDQEYTQRIAKIDAELKHWLPEEPDSEWAEKVFGDIGRKADLESIKLLLAPLRELLFRGGKRWRPLLMILVCETFGGGDAAIPLSPVVEFSHNASLIHDDIEDASDERRGKPAIHKIFGIDVGINSGSFFYFLASACIDSHTQNADTLNKSSIYKLWMDCIRRLHLGQSMDINWHRNTSFIPALDEYFLMCALKTGSLARLSTELGALIPGVLPDTVKSLGDAADKLGIGFQILDDVKNLTTGIHGKKRGDDVVEGKKSLPVILYLNKYPEKQNRIFEIFNIAKQKGSAAPEVEELISILSSSGVLEEAEEIGKSLLTEAKGIFRNHKFDDFALLDNFINLIS
ncbi:MAG: polyprenyl synthetase family protein [Treponema sp.]|jgi:octaprenyl-diphosphate synthase|nr:polyprenyl synthetase family protein [Treponema sp.]